MAITVGTSGAGNIVSVGGYPQNNLTVNHTLRGGTNRMVLIFFCLHGNTSYSILTAQYNSVNIAGKVISTANPVICSPVLYGRAPAIFAFCLLEADLPAAGTYAVTMKESAAYAGTVMVLDLDNVVQSVPTTAASGTSKNPEFTSGTSYSTNITSTASTSLVVDAAVNEQNAGGNASTPGTGQTDLFGTVSGTGATYSWGSYKFASGAGSQTRTWTPQTEYSHYEHLVLTIDDIAGGGGGSTDNAALIGSMF